MPVSLSIKAVPDVLVDRLRRRAEGNHRSLQRELMAIVEAAVLPQPQVAPAKPELALPASSALTLSEPVPAWHVTVQSADDGLLDELDGIVAGSRWGDAPLLTREQLHDRSLARELDFDARQAERAVVPKPRKSSAS